MGPQRVRHNWVTELNWKAKVIYVYVYIHCSICVLTFLYIWTYTHSEGKNLKQLTRNKKLTGWKYREMLPMMIFRSETLDNGCFLNYILNIFQIFCIKHELCVYAWSLSCVWLFVTPWTEARQAPLSTVFSRQEHWSGLPCPPPGDLPNPEIEPRSPTLQADSLSSKPPGSPNMSDFC